MGNIWCNKDEVDKDGFDNDEFGCYNILTPYLKYDFLKLEIIITYLIIHFGRTQQLKIRDIYEKISSKPELLYKIMHFMIDHNFDIDKILTVNEMVEIMNTKIVLNFLT